MPKTKISEFSATPGNNTDIDGINIAEGCAPSGINDAIRELMSQLKDFQAGTAGDSFNGPVGTTTAAAGAFTTLSASGAVTLSGGTANGVAYLNGSKVLTTGSALTFDGTTFGNTFAGAPSGTTELLKLSRQNSGTFIKIVRDAGSGNAGGLIGADSVGTYYAGSTTANMLYIDTANTNLQFYANGSEQMRLTSTGLGIGTSSPSYKLHVVDNGNINATSAISNSTAGTSSLARFIAISDAGNAQFGMTSSGYTDITGAADALLLNASNASGGMAFALDGVLKMKLDSSGNLGIGTSSPGKKLEVANSDALIYGLTVGRGAGAVATNTAVGASALVTNTTGVENVAVGNRAAESTTTASDVTAVGFRAARANTTGTPTAFGAYALDGNTTGTNNTALGSQALFSNTTASNNTAVGYQAGYTGTTATNNTFVGYQAGYLATGSGNTFVGKSAGNAVSTGAYNTLMGYASGNVLTTGSSNTFIGSGSAGSAGEAITTGSKNTILGAYSGNQGGLDIRTASNRIVLSDGDGNPRLIADDSGNWVTGSKRSAAQAGQGCIFYGTGQSAGAYITGDGGPAMYVNREASDGTIVDIRRAASTVGSISVTTTATAYNTSSDYRLKDNQQPLTGSGAFIDALQPKTWDWKSGGKGVGFIAHEVQDVSPNSVTGAKDAVDGEGQPVMQAMEYGSAEFIANIIAELQSLRKRVAELEAK